MSYVNDLPSTEFRKRFARLSQITIVTVNGHVIGKWIPMGRPEDVQMIDGEVFVERDPAYVEPSFGSPRPAPKPGQKR
jgi:hypothetical protein